MSECLSIRVTMLRSRAWMCCDGEIYGHACFAGSPQNVQFNVSTHAGDLFQPPVTASLAY